MKSTYLSLILLCGTGTVMAQKQEKAHITAEIRNLDDKEIYVANSPEVNAGQWDTLRLKNGKYTGTINVGTIPERRRFWMGRYRILMWVEPGNIHIEGDASEDGKFTASGTKTINDDRAYNEGTDSIRSTVYARFEHQFKAAEKDSVASRKLMGEYFGEFTTALTAYEQAFVAAHPDSYKSLDVIAAMGGDYDDIARLFSRLSPALRTSTRGKAFSQKMTVSARSAAGKKVLNFTRDDLDGKPVSINAFKGQYVLIDFWASWCKPCRAENPNVLAAYNKYKDHKFTVLGVSIDDDTDKWRKAVEEDGMPWTQVRDRKDRKSKILDYYGIDGIPSQLLIDPDGVIIARDLRGPALEKKLAEVLK